MRTHRTHTRFALGVGIAFGVLACSTDSVVSIDDDPEGVSVDITPILSQFGSEVEVSIDGDVVVLRSNGVPNHVSPYFDQSNSQYAAYDGSNTNFALNPNTIAEQNLVFRVPKEVQQATNNAATPLGPIGVAVNGIALAAGRGRMDPSHEHWAALSALRQSLPEMRSYLRAVVDEQRRRGIRLFAAFREAEDGQSRG